MLLGPAAGRWILGARRKRPVGLVLTGHIGLISFVVVHVVQRVDLRRASSSAPFQYLRGRRAESRRVPPAGALRSLLPVAVLAICCSLMIGIGFILLLLVPGVDVGGDLLVLRRRRWSSRYSVLVRRLAVLQIVDQRSGAGPFSAFSSCSSAHALCGDDQCWLWCLARSAAAFSVIVTDYRSWLLRDFADQRLHRGGQLRYLLLSPRR